MLCNYMPFEYVSVANFPALAFNVQEKRFPIANIT